jgi:hypothetical protein
MVLSKESAAQDSYVQVRMRRFEHHQRTINLLRIERSENIDTVHGHATQKMNTNKFKYKNVKYYITVNLVEIRNGILKFLQPNPYQNQLYEPPVNYK